MYSEEAIKNLKGFIELTSKMDEKGLSYEEAIEILDNVVLEKTKEVFVTVTDGWRGSLKLKECWVKYSNEWAVERDVEVISRCNDEHDKDVFVYYDHKNELCLAKELKFRPFSHENPAPVDWPVNVYPNARVYYFRGFSGEDTGVQVFNDGHISTGEDLYTTFKRNEATFLNIEPVED